MEGQRKKNEHTQKTKSLWIQLVDSELTLDTVCPFVHRKTCKVHSEVHDAAYVSISLFLCTSNIQIGIMIHRVFTYKRTKKNECKKIFIFSGFDTKKGWKKRNTTTYVARKYVPSHENICSYVCDIIFPYISVFFPYYVNVCVYCIQQYYNDENSVQDFSICKCCP